MPSLIGLDFAHVISANIKKYGPVILNRYV